jgi:trehalose/maltose hydrolase-like predicted phosphorylase
MARFWKSRVVHNKKRNIYKIKHVMGPDEFHFNVDNNAYTNKLVAWSLNKTLDYIKQLEIQFPSEVSQKLDELKFNLQERARLAKIAKGIWIPMHDKIVLEFENFLSLEYYRLPSLNIFGLPTLPSFLLVAELYKTQYIKQGDVVLLLLLLPQCFDLKTAQANYHFYAARSLQKSSWGPPITSAVAAQIENTVKAYQYFQVTLNTDKKNIFENTDKGMHTPAVGGSWIAMMYGFCGIRILDDRVLITPNLPELWQSVTTQFCYLDFVVKLMITKMQIRIRLDKSDNAWLLRQTLRKPTNAINVQIGKSVKQLLPNQEYLFALESPSSCFDTNANSG